MASNSRRVACCVVVTCALCVCLSSFTVCKAKEDMNGEIRMRHFEIYQQLEKAVLKNPELLFRMKTIFSTTLLVHPYQSLAGAHTLLAHLCVDITSPNKNCSNAQTNANFVALTKSYPQITCWYFLWSESPLFSIIPTDQLLAFDPIITTTIYSAIVGSFSHKNLAYGRLVVDHLPCNTTENEVIVAAGMLISWGKAYSKSNGVPSVWDGKDLGYVTRWYNYYTVVPIPELYNAYSEGKLPMRKALILLFVVVNIFFMMATNLFGHSLFHGIQIAMDHRSKHVHYYYAFFIVVCFMNIAYCLGITSLHAMNYPAIWPSKIVNPLPEQTNAFKYNVYTFTAKVIIFAAAVVAQFLAAVKLVSSTEDTKYARKAVMKVVYYVRVVMVWQVLLFLQGIVGLVSIPILLLALLGPTTVLMVASDTLLLTLSFILAVGYLISYRRNKEKSTIRNISSFLCRLLWCSVLVVSAATLVLLYYLLTQWSNLEGLKGIILSFLPSIALSILVWLIKRKLQKKMGIRRGEEKKQTHYNHVEGHSSESTDDELIQAE